MVDVFFSTYQASVYPQVNAQSNMQAVRWLFQAASVEAKSVFDRMPVGLRLDELSILIDREEDLEAAFDAIPEELRVWM